MYKIKNALNKNKKVFIIALILWIAMSILLIAPITVSKVEASSSDEFFDMLFENFGSVGKNLGKIFKVKYFSTFKNGELYLFITLLIFVVMGILKSLPKNEYTDIEHGSSDWSKNGEQYRILNPKKGIILAEKNYLPVDKRGNVNVLVVGRFWFW